MVNSQQGRVDTASEPVSFNINQVNVFTIFVPIRVAALLIELKHMEWVNAMF